MDRSAASPDTAQLEAASGAEVDRYYDRSPVVSGATQPGLAGPVAGRLVPLTALVRSPDGTVSALHDVARRLRHTLFVLGGSDASGTDVAAVLNRLGPAADSEFVDATYEFVVDEGHDTADPRVGGMSVETASQLGVEGPTVLAVRPDRYLGMRRDGAETTGTGYLTDYLATLSA